MNSLVGLAQVDLVDGDVPDVPVADAPVVLFQPSLDHRLDRIPTQIQPPRDVRHRHEAGQVHDQPGERIRDFRVRVGKGGGAARTRPPSWCCASAVPSPSAPPVSGRWKRSAGCASEIHVAPRSRLPAATDRLRAPVRKSPGRLRNESAGRRESSTEISALPMAVCRNPKWSRYHNSKHSLDQQAVISGCWWFRSRSNARLKLSQGKLSRSKTTQMCS